MKAEHFSLLKNVNDRPFVISHDDVRYQDVIDLQRKGLVNTSPYLRNQCSKV